MKLKYLVLILGLLFSSQSLAYAPKMHYSRLKHKRSLHVWFRRDLTFLDLRTQLVQTLREIRIHLARAEAEGLSPSEKSTLKGLESALEKEMLKAQENLKKLTQELNAEIEKEKPSINRYQEIVRKIQDVWENLLLKNFEIRQKIKEILKSENY